VEAVLDKATCRIISIYALTVGLAYIAVGAVELANALYTWFVAPGAEEALLPLPGIPAGDLFGGLSSLVVGAVLVRAVPLWKSRREDLAFVLVGTLLACIFGVLYLLLSAANALSALVAGGEELAEWLASGWIADLSRPEIWLFAASIPMAILSWRGAVSSRC